MGLNTGFSTREPAFLHDPELYNEYLRGWRKQEPLRCQVQGEGCEPYEPQHRCDQCKEACCEACTLETGIGDNRRCLDCEDKNLAKLQAACRLMGTLPYQNRLAEALMNEKEEW